MHPIIVYQGEELSTSLFTSTSQEAVENDEVATQPPVFQTRQTQTPQPLLTGQVELYLKFICLVIGIFCLCFLSEYMMCHISQAMCIYFSQIS